MKKIEVDAEEHNRRVIERKKELARQERAEKELLHLYEKGLSKDDNTLWTESVFWKRVSGQGKYELGRRLIVLRARNRGNFLNLLEEHGIGRRKAYEAMNAVMNIPDADLKALSKNARHDFELPESTTPDAEELGAKIEKDRDTLADFARRSPTDIKKMVGRLERQAEEIEKLKRERAALEGEVKDLKLGSADERAVREMLGKGQLQFSGFINRMLAVKKDVSEQTKMDVVAALRWLGYQLLLTDITIADRWPEVDTCMGPDRAATADWLERHGRTGTSFMVPEGGESPLTGSGPAAPGEKGKGQKGKRGAR